MNCHKFLMIGKPATGKTSYLAAAYGVLREGVCVDSQTYKSIFIDLLKKSSSSFLVNILSFLIEPYLSVNNGSLSIKAIGDDSQAQLDSMSADLKLGQYPLPTNKRDEYEFEFFYNSKSLFSFCWKDIYGGLIYANTDSEFNALRNDMQEAVGLMVFFDSQEVVKGKVNNELRKILKLITLNLNSIDSPFCINIVLTKYDMVYLKNDIDINNCSITPLIEIASNNSNIKLSVTKVSCTKEEFVNVEIPILQMTNFFLKNGILSDENELVKQNQTLRWFESSTSRWDDFTSRIKSEKSYRTLAEEKQKEIDKLSSLISTKKEAERILDYYLTSYNNKY